MAEVISSNSLSCNPQDSNGVLEQDISPLPNCEISSNSPDILPSVSFQHKALTDEGSNDIVPKDNKWQVKGFASKQDLAHWFPQIEVDEHQSWRIWLSKRSQALLMHTIGVGAVFIANTALTIFAISHYPYPNGIGTIYEGSCSTAKKLDLWLHLLINILSTELLMASNYCMQLQAAPTRENIDKAHKNDTWLDIGVPSLRNFAWVGNWRRSAWLLLAITSLPVHLIYNSAVFTSLASSDYTVAVVNKHFLTHGSWNLTAAAVRGEGDPGLSWVFKNPEFDWRIPILTPKDTISKMQRNATEGLYQMMNVSTCFEIYDDYWSAVGNVVIIAKNDTRPRKQQANDSLLIYASIVPNSDDWAKNQWAIENGTQASTIRRAQVPASQVETWYLGPAFYEVDYCLVQPPAMTTARCRFEYSFPIMLTICILNLVKVCIMLIIWWLRKYQWDARQDHQKIALYTLGDAIQSFMQNPETRTAGMCLTTKDHFRRRRTRRTRFTKPALELPQEPITWERKYRYWGAAASTWRWVFLLSTAVVILAVDSSLLVLAATSLKLRGIETSITRYWQLGFGALTPWTYINIGLPKKGPVGLISNVIFANLPQLVLSIIYLFNNAMLSCFLVQMEFSQMWKKRKPLRVSEREGIQRSSHFISLPLKYGIPLYVSSGIMHWLVSQSFFLARITAFFPDGTVDSASSFSTCGYSPIALFITILVKTTLVFGVVALGFRHYDGHMPLVSTNSFAISASCHALEEDKTDGHLMPVQWGVVEIQNGIGHCTFTTAYDDMQPNDEDKYK